MAILAHIGNVFSQAIADIGKLLCFPAMEVLTRILEAVIFTSSPFPWKGVSRTVLSQEEGLQSALGHSNLMHTYLMAGLANTLECNLSISSIAVKHIFMCQI